MKDVLAPCRPPYLPILNKNTAGGRTLTPAVYCRREQTLRSGVLGGVSSKGFEALFCMFAPLGARHVISRIEHVFTAGLAQSSGVVLEELDLSAAMCASYFINIVQLPVPQILSRAVQFGHGYIRSRC